MDRFHGSTRLLVVFTAIAAACSASTANDVADAANDARADVNDAPSSDTMPPTPDASNAIVRCVTNTGGAGLNLRDQPSTNGTILLTMPAGSRVHVLSGPIGVDSAWYQVDYQGTPGYAHGDYLAPCPEPGTGQGFNFLLPWTAGVAYRISQGHNTGSHTGNGGWAWDMALSVGTPLLAAHGGVVRIVRYDSDFGACDSSAADAANYVVIDRGDGLESLYLHLQYLAPAERPLVEGQVVDRGAFIGYSGQTGWSCGAHLHFQIQRSPQNGGTASWYNPSVHEYFWDTDEPYDPPLGAEPVSANGTSTQPRHPRPLEKSNRTGSLSGHGPAWDTVMKQTAALVSPRG